MPATTVDCWLLLLFCTCSGPQLPLAQDLGVVGMAPKHSWESDDDVAPASAKKRRSWESDAESDNGSDSTRSGEQSSVERPGQDLVDHLLGLYFCRSMSAEQVCIAMYHAGRAGVKEAVQFGFRPSAPSGHYQRHLNAVIPELRDRHKLYSFPIPASDPDGGRMEHVLDVFPPHELAAEFFDDGLQVELDRQVKAGELPDVYRHHPVVSQVDGPVVPFSLFLDGVPYSHVDSVIGVWLVEEITGKRALVAAIRKAICCTCGCKGWCTLQAVFLFLHWSLSCLAAGFYPSQRHDGSEFDEHDSWRSPLAGAPLPCKGCILYVKADWAELSTTFGFASWQDGLRPCPHCNCSPESLYVVSGISPVSSPWEANTHADYEAACARCERVVRVDAVAHTNLVRVLKYDRREKGSRGLALSTDIPQLGLVAGDRLVSFGNVFDVGKFSQVAEFPVEAKFWRRSCETLVRMRNPLFDSALGITVQSLTTDLLHAFYLGVLQIFCRKLVWDMLAAGAWGMHASAAQTISSGMIVCRQSLVHFYHQRHKDCPTEFLTRVHRLSKKHLGDNADRTCKMKGAQTWGFFLFLMDYLRPRVPMLGGEFVKLLRAGDALLALVAVYKAAPTRFKATHIQSSVDAWCTFLAETATFEDMRIPKRHVMSHMALKAKYFGNPRKYANWEDESCNKLLKQACRSVSQVTFERFLLLRFKILLRKRAAKQPSRSD